MLDILTYKFMQNAIIAAILAGASCSLVGVLVVTMNIPFVGVCMSHAAFAGALLGLLSGTNPVLMAFLFSFSSAALIGPIADKGELDPDISIGIIFSVMLGLAFLFMGIMKGPKTQALELLWGSILTVTSADLQLIALVGSIVTLLVVLFFKEIQAVIFHREVAASVGIPERAILYGLLFLTGATVTASFRTIGGLLIFSLIVNPAAAAYQFTYSLKKMFVLAAILGIGCCLTGLYASYVFGAPSGAVIIVISAIIFGLAVVLSPKRRVKKLNL